VTDLVVRKIPWEFDEVVPFEDRGASAQELLLSQALHHDPADQPLPDWADTWMREYAQGRDMTTFFPRSSPQLEG
jgi:hypothetical protein